MTKFWYNLKADESKDSEKQARYLDIFLKQVETRFSGVGIPRGVNSRIIEQLTYCTSDALSTKREEIEKLFAGYAGKPTF